MKMKLFKEEVKRMKYRSLDNAFKELSKMICLVYIKRTKDKFIFELKNGEIFTMDNDDIFDDDTLKCKYLNKVLFEKKIRIAGDWKKTKNYESLNETEKFNFIRHEISLKDSLNKLLKLTNITKGRFLIQRDLVDQIAIIYGYLKRNKNYFEIYLGTDYDLCTIVKLSIHKARKYYKLYHDLHERDDFISFDENEIPTTSLGNEVFIPSENIEVYHLKNINLELSQEIEFLRNEKRNTAKVINNKNLEIKKLESNLKDLESSYYNISDIKDSQSKIIDKQVEEIKKFEDEIFNLKNSLNKKSFLGRILGL